METLLQLLGSGSAGALVGLVGGWLTKIEERKQKVMENKHALEMRQLDLQELTLEHKQQIMMVDKNIDLAETEGAIKLDSLELDAFAESQKPGGDWMERAKSIVRPLLTLYVVGFSTYIFAVVSKEVGGLQSLPVTELMELFHYIITQIIFLTILSFSWWFAARPSSVRHKLRRDS